MIRSQTGREGWVSRYILLLYYMLHGRYVKMCMMRWMHDAGLEMSKHVVYVC